jgi:CRP-like cAMP-binding protein
MAQLKLLYQIPESDPKKVAEELATCPLFAGLDSDGALERLAELVSEKTFVDRELLMRQNELQDALLIFVEGKVSALASAETPFAPALKVAVFEPQTTYGEEFLIEPALSKFALSAETHGRFYRLDGLALDQFSREYPEQAFKLQARMSRNLLIQMKKAQDHLRLLQSVLDRF